MARISEDTLCSEPAAANDASGASTVVGANSAGGVNGATGAAGTAEASAAAGSRVYALCACELSGDTLGLGLMLAIRRRDPRAVFVGIGGPKMIACGMKSLANISELSVMGVTDVLAHLVPIVKIRMRLIRELKELRPCVFVGIDSPDFNLRVERKLRQAGVPTVHYVCPSVWAWRENRVSVMRQSCERVLCLLKFEQAFLEERHMPCTYVGHTLASAIPLNVDQTLARERIDLYRNSVEEITGRVMGILPGSRPHVIARMLPVFAQTARLIRRELPDTAFVTTLPTYELAVLVKDIWLEHAPDLSLTIYVGNSHDVIASCDAALLTSGTVALEAMLLKCPFAVGYKLSAVNAVIGRHLIKIRTFSLPNLIAARTLVKEFIQDDCRPDLMADEMKKLLVSDNLLMKVDFRNIHVAMRRNSDELAAKAVFEVIAAHSGHVSAEAAGGTGGDSAAADARDTDLASGVTLVPGLTGGSGVSGTLPGSNSGPHGRNVREPEITLPSPGELPAAGDRTEPRFGP